MQYTILRVFPEATRRGLKEGDRFVPSNTESAHALLAAGLLRAEADGTKRKPVAKKKLTLGNDARMSGGFNRQNALSGAPQNKDAASLRRNK
jgi:hypothetical protein